MLALSNYQRTCVSSGFESGPWCPHPGQLPPFKGATQRRKKQRLQSVKPSPSHLDALNGLHVTLPT